MSFSCGFLETAGGGTETSNGATVFVSDSRIGLHGAEGSSAFIYHSAYNPYLDSGFADTIVAVGGRDRSVTLDSGQYHVYIWATEHDAAIQIRDLSADSDTSITVTLSPPGAIAGTVGYALGVTPDSAALYLRGSPFWTSIEGNAFIIEHVPAGAYAGSIALYAAGAVSVQPIRNEGATGNQNLLEVVAGDTAALDEIIIK